MFERWGGIGTVVNQKNEKWLIMPEKVADPWSSSFFMHSAGIDLICMADFQLD